MSVTFKIGICGAGQFAQCFIPLFKMHPGVSDVVLCDVDAARCKSSACKHGIQSMVEKFDDLLNSDIDAVAIFTPRHDHAEFSIKALKAGKHVYCAVPAAQTIDELQALINAVNETGLIYMMGETSYYYPASIYCRHRYKAGHLGDFVYGEGEYLHDMAHGFYSAYRHNGGTEWKKRAGFPPMLYPTHSTSMLVSVTGASLSRVSCLGYRDKHADGIFQKNANYWDNEFSNETALFRTTNGGMFRVNEFRRIGIGAGNSVRTSIFGTYGSFEQQSDSHIWSDINKKLYSLNELLDCDCHDKGTVEDGIQSDFFTGTAIVHPTDRLPDSFKGLRNGHYGSHHFLVDDFVRSLQTGYLPPNHVWAAAKYTIPGIIAHQSALKEGELIDIPELGEPPAQAEYLEKTLQTISEAGQKHIDSTAPDLTAVDMGEG
ncbi:Gfo/Idh/MocA family oxidoreductase [Rubellicoccus peritrichatus]|uniref:Gfo/Idh/MocA family oxidoreductase n=1 Tax=Rubellicoccus peritrichatus TaxID=3080537 RepID=A0AAQ3LCX4_9BACT|nr:Gfo/Idh/MocA family oxidoreductase [Puniceicoccus sp. CR14]WOO43709.1 Gfo/Idh/MocA family oxidoreductase [Puniceicoccus sp. CR14]